MSAHDFPITATWDVNEKKGRVSSADDSLSATHSGATALGGIGVATNPEELLGAAVSTCFVQTWAIFLAKLKIPHETPGVAATVRVDADPAGGFRVTSIEVRPRIPAALFEEHRAALEKTLSLAEKYCIISKAVRADGSVLRVVPEIV